VGGVGALGFRDWWHSRRSPFVRLGWICLVFSWDPLISAVCRGDWLSRAPWVIPRAMSTWCRMGSVGFPPSPAPAIGALGLSPLVSTHPGPNARRAPSESLRSGGMGWFSRPTRKGLSF